MIPTRGPAVAGPLAFTRERPGGFSLLQDLHSVPPRTPGAERGAYTDVVVLRAQDRATAGVCNFPDTGVNPLERIAYALSPISVLS